MKDATRYPVLNPNGLSINLVRDIPKRTPEIVHKDERPGDINPIAQRNWDSRIKNGEIKYGCPTAEITFKVLEDLHSPEDKKIVPGMVFQCDQCPADLVQGEKTKVVDFIKAVKTHIEAHAFEQLNKWS